MNTVTHKMKSINFSVICCYYNELNILKKEFDKFEKFSSELNFEHEFIFVDNNSTDGTREEILYLKKRNKSIYYIFRPRKLGIGSAHKDGLKFAYKKKQIVK